MTIAVYKVSGPYTASVYYGYSTNEDVRTSFMTGTQRTDAEDRNRGDFRMLQSNKGNDATLVFTIIDEFDDEFDAWCMRNDYRANDARSITGPTMFPTTAFTRAKKEAPGRVLKWTRARQYNTALEAYQDGVWSYPAISALSKNLGKTIVQKALAALTPAEFAAQYIG